MRDNLKRKAPNAIMQSALDTELLNSDTITFDDDSLEGTIETLEIELPEDIKRITGIGVINCSEETDITVGIYHQIPYDVVEEEQTFKPVKLASFDVAMSPDELSPDEDQLSGSFTLVHGMFFTGDLTIAVQLKSSIEDGFDVYISLYNGD